MKSLLLLIFFNMLVALNAQSAPEYNKKELLRFGSKALNDEIASIDVFSAGENQLSGIFLKLISHNKKEAIAYVGRVNTCNATGCNISNDKQSFEFFDYFILFDLQANVLEVKIYNYAATHGHEVTSKAWLKQFKAYNSSRSLVVGKDIDAISGATTSVNSLTNNIQLITSELAALLKKGQ